MKENNRRESVMECFLAAVAALLWTGGAMALDRDAPRSPETPAAVVVEARFANNDATLWSPCLEWGIKNPPREGNPFDIVAKATFTHAETNEKHTTELFYRGNETWSFRFTATRAGEWAFATRADGGDGTTSDPELHGRTGRIHVRPHPDSKIRGFIRHRGNRFARQVSDRTDLEGFLPNTYMNQRHFGNAEGRGWIDITPTLTDLAKFESYMDEVVAHGCNGVFVHVTNQWFKAHIPSHDRHDSKDPDLETFTALEQAIVMAHRRGLYVHIWAWGDEARKWTPIGVGGINGEADRRLQRYIAARLGPLPGWVMGYGFDLNEWTKEAQLQAWARHLHDRMGWRHMVWGRDRYNAELDAKSYPRYHVRDYATIVTDLDSDLKRPHLYEERHTHLRNDDLSMSGTRRFRWDMAMAGGMMGFWGHYPHNYKPYPEPEQLQTHDEFWNGRRRFRLDLIRDAGLTSSGVALRSADNLRAVVYAEDTDSIEVDLSRMAKTQPAVAVDTTAAYREIELGKLLIERTTIRLPRSSDWAIAIGHFHD